FTVGRGDLISFDDAYIDVLSLQTGERKTLVQGGSYGWYAPTGHLVFARAGSILAVPFDLERLEVTGSEVPVVSNVMTHP
ncbi:hypothetical protein MYX77_14730, partial [Acidobacteriia bacterium AH_259_A11_L15]|nr:hypothetical protein [Acidobacteriia bacterium AH_259_A11_L15]